MMRAEGIVFSLLALATSACVSSSHANEARPAEEAATPVETQAVGERDVPTTISLTGTLGANRHSQVASDGTGRVVATYVERGSFVRQGEPLVRLDTRGAAMSRAEAD